MKSVTQESPFISGESGARRGHTMDLVRASAYFLIFVFLIFYTYFYTVLLYFYTLLLYFIGPIIIHR
jgi:hypothetical protein